jgi:hypothetical protein
MRYLLLILCLFCCGCAAMSVAISKKDLNVQTLMSDTIFMDPENETPKTVFIVVRNTTDKNVNIESLLSSQLQARGYAIEQTPSKAGYILQVNVLQIGMTDPNAYEASVKHGPAFWGSSAAAVGAGAATGALIGYGATGLSGTGALGGAVVGGVAAGILEVAINSAVKDVTYSMITDVLVSEKAEKNVSETRQTNVSTGRGSSVSQSVDKKTGRIRYATRIGSSANQVNLKFEEAQPELEGNLARSIAGIF